MTYRYEGFAYNITLRPHFDDTGRATGKVWGYVSWRGGIPHSEWLIFGMSYEWPFDVDFTLHVKAFPGERAWVMGSEFIFTPRVPIERVDWPELGKFVQSLVSLKSA